MIFTVEETTLAAAFLYRILRLFFPLIIGLPFNHREAVLQADQVAQFLQREPGSPEVFELSDAIDTGGIEYHMIMNVSSICVRRHDERILAFGKTEGELIANPVGFLRSHFSRFEGLSYLVSNHITVLALPGDLIVLALLQHEFLINGKRIALIGGDQFAFFGFLRILGIIRSLAEAFRYGPAMSRMHSNESCRCHLFSFPQK